MKIYVVSGSTGEYSDRSEWPVKAFASKEKAEELVAAATARAKQIEATRPSKYGLPAKGLNEFDPEMWMDYTGTSYEMAEVEFDAEVS